MPHLTAPAETPRAAPPGINRRAAIRWRPPPAMPGRVYVSESFKSLFGWVLDLSAVGIGLLLPHRLDADTLVRIELEPRTHAGTVELPARVAHALPQRNGDWIVGCAFETPLPADQLEALL